MTFTLPAQPVVLPAADTVSHTDNHMQLIVAALLGIATIVLTLPSIALFGLLIAPLAGLAAAGAGHH